ncbi:MAG: SlyX family protein [Gammaproteobacteria bacterium]|nr:SlyX family protein [Gammaproteobacteria bacterium]
MDVKTLAIAMAAVCTCVWAGPGLADMTMEERMERLEQRLRYLENRVNDQDETIRQKDRTIAELKRQQDKLAPRWERVEERLDAGDTDGGWFQGVEV